MTEGEAKNWISARWNVSCGTLSHFAELVIKESTRQNLISAATLPNLWARHIVDSAQLLALSEDDAASWLDIGTGAGFPGMVIAILRKAPITLCEPRRMRAEFLSRCAEALDLDHVTVAQVKAERLAGSFNIISARAVANCSTLIASAQHLATPETLWILPKGRTASEEVETARRSWHGAFHMEQSLTDPEAKIVVAKNIRRR